MVSICGGEPLIYPQIEAMVKGLLEQKRIVYICTNAMFMRKKMREWLASENSKRSAFVEGKIKELIAAGLLTEKDAEEIRKGPKDAAKPTIGPSRWMYWNVHLDGLERTHDLIVEREGVFKECVLAIKMAKCLGYQVATNTTIYKETDVDEVEQMFDFLSDLGVDGHTISPGYDYDAAKKDMITRLNLQPENFFLTRKMTVEKFSRDRRVDGGLHPLRDAGLFRISRRQTRSDLLSVGDSDAQHAGLESAVLFHDRQGRNRRPLQAYAEMLEKVQWDKYGVVDGVARDPRCENCMMHCGYEPTASLGPASATRRHVEDSQI